MRGFTQIKLSLLVFVSGLALSTMSCAQLLGIEDLPAPDARPPGREDGGSPLGELGLASLEPATVKEGEGAAWPVPIIVHGENIASNATVELTGPGIDLGPLPAIVAGDGSKLGFGLTVPVLTALAEGATEAITVTVRSGGDSASLVLTIEGLDELVASAVSQPGEVTAADLAPLYSRIDIDEDLTFTGSEPIRLVATAEILLDGSLLASGQAGFENAPGQGGPAGCVGGLQDGDGGCGPGGGQGGGDDGAGGGGHFTIGTPGGGDPSNLGGMPTGRPEMVPLANEQGHGGGGARDVAGGGGGGIIELTTRGLFTVGQNGQIAADGGKGADGICSGSVNNGSGGGGSGGGILVRAWGGFVDDSDTVALSVRGGDGGEIGPDTDCDEVGGAGSAGRMRVDNSIADLPAFAQGQPNPFQGPQFRNRDASNNPIPVVVALPNLTLDLVGQPSQEFFVDVNGDGRELVTTSATGAGSVLVQLRAGLNRICAFVDQTTSLELSEGVQCIEIAYIP